MADPHLFWTIFGAVLGAIMLGGTFFWSLASYSRMEREGVEHSRRGNLTSLGIFMPLVICALSMMIAFGKTGLLDAVLQ